MRKTLFLQRFGARGDSIGNSKQPGGGRETLRPATFRDFLKAPPQKSDRFSPPSAETNLVIFFVNSPGKALKTAPAGDGPGGAPGGCPKTRTFFWNRALAAVKVTFWVIEKGAVLRLGCCQNGVPEKVTHFCEEKGPEFGQSRKRYVLNGEPHFCEVFGGPKCAEREKTRPRPPDPRRAGQREPWADALTGKNCMSGTCIRKLEGPTNPVRD